MLVFSFISTHTPTPIYPLSFFFLLLLLPIPSQIYDFVGDRRFGGVKRQASVMSIAPVAASVSQAKHGSESFKAHTLSQQFKNLCRGESFVMEQMAKWKHPKTGLKKGELMIIESLAYDTMKYFEYEAAHVKAPCDGKNYTSFHSGIVGT